MMKRIHRYSTAFLMKTILTTAASFALALAFNAAVESAPSPLRQSDYQDKSTLQQRANELDDQGGPDDFGYVYIDSEEDDGPDYDWTDISETGTRVNNIGDDDHAGPFEIGFDFPYYGEEYDEFYVASNGYISFGEGFDNWRNVSCPNTSDPNNALFLFVEDLNPAVNGDIYYGEDGDGNLVCQFQNIPDYGANNTRFTAEIIIYPDGRILFQYNRLLGTDRSGECIGIENSNGRDGLQVSLNNNPGNYPYEGLAILFSPPPPATYLEGIVRDARTNSPVENALVELFDEDEELEGSSYSEANGAYLIDGLSSGTYAAEITMTGYFELLVEDITIVAPDPTTQNFELLPFYEATIEEIQDEFDENAWVITEGIVTIPTNKIDDQHTSFYIADESGYGVWIYGDEPWPDGRGNLERGDLIHIFGRTEEFQSMTRIVDFIEIELISARNRTPVPISGTAMEIALLDEMEGSVALLEGYLQNDPENNGDYSITLNDGSGDCNVMIYGVADLDLSEYGEDDWIIVRGVIRLIGNDVHVTPSLSQDIFQSTQYVPHNLAAEFTDWESGEVTISWEHDVVELKYDNGTNTGVYAWPPNTMAVRMSPEYPCQLLALKYYITSDGEMGQFNAEVYDWLGLEPGELLYTRHVEDLQVDSLQWVEVDVSDQELFFDLDFIVGFGSVDEEVKLGYDRDLESERSWDYIEGEWIANYETYLIRAVVQYSEGVLAELDAFIEFAVYRDGEPRVRTTELSYSDELPEYGTYTYTVSAIYHEGETELSEELPVTWSEYSLPADNKQVLPQEWSIESVYPNPFNPSVNINIAVPISADVKVEVLNILGQNVAMLMNGRIETGIHRMTWNAAHFPAGIYFVHVLSGTSIDITEKMLLLK
ncbi:carboxypeptidase regulatory-like domain-containing protein [Calditrichota bacterium]